ncbi:MAG TPA: MgtC/SapB family protein, partial [Phormidium sp.]
MLGLSTTNAFAPLELQELLFRLLTALVVGAIVGIERERHRKAAGLRTYILVSVGTAFLVLVPIQAGMAQQSVEAISRVLQGIITGIGFLGGGVILHNNSTNQDTLVRLRPHGLTSASAVWLCCGLGIATGFGLWLLALIGALLAWF